VEADKAALEMAATDNDLVFASPTGSPMLLNTVTHAFSKLARKAGINIRFHDLRHTHVSRLIKIGPGGKYIANRVEHSTISTTMDVYGHLFNDAQREISIKFGKGIFVNLVSILEGWSTNSKRERPSVPTEGLILCLK
jgi:integrase